MRHALLDGNRIVNIVEIDPRNVSDFPNAVTIPDGVGAGIGDIYRDGRFYRYNETQQEEEILPYDPMAAYAKALQEQKLTIDQLTVDADYRLLMLETMSMA